MIRLTREEFVRFVLSSAAGRETTTAPELDDFVEGMMGLVPYLRDSKKQIVDDLLTAIVTAVGDADVLFDDETADRWLDGTDRAGWLHWPWLNRYLAEVEFRPLAVLNELHHSSDEVIDLLGDPKREGIWDRRGLVVGHVQSGKTEHYTTVAAKAIDAGYKVVIILSGIHENLRQQTQERIERLIIGKDSRNAFQQSGIRQWSSKRLAVQVPGDPTSPLPDISTLTSVAGDYGAAVNSTTSVTPGHAPLILVVKKNVSILRNLLTWIKGSNAAGILHTPTLVIDDEADHSSINTNAADPETDPTRINELIRKVLWRCDRVGFVGYTATPYANIFADPRLVEKTRSRNLEELGPDLFPKSFIISLKAPTNYIGPEEVFGRAGDADIDVTAVAPLPMHRTAADSELWLPARHKKSHSVSSDLPPSLREALRVFLLGVAARQALGHTSEHASMLVHVSRFTDVQEQITKHLEAEMGTFVEGLRHSATADADWAELETIWRDVFESNFSAFRNHPSQQLVKPVLPSWDNVRAQILIAYSRMVFRTINSGSKENLDYTGSPEGLVVVAVGGDRLSRGLTLSGLLVSYFQRGARAFDTLMQMARWFGYRPGYAHLCRVYAPQGVLASFKMVALATEELRREFTRMCYLKRKPTDYGLRIREPRVDMLVTAMNKMRRGESVRVHFAESLVSSLTIPRTAAKDNASALYSLLSDLAASRGVPQLSNRTVAGEPVSGHRRWEDVPGEAVAGFLGSYRASVNVAFEGTADGSSMISRYVSSMIQKGELRSWTVAVFGNKTSNRAFADLEFGSVTRQLDADKKNVFSRDWVFRGVALGEDESIDLSTEELIRARAIEEETDARSRAACYRYARPPERGLLLIYPLFVREAPDEFVVGVAASFPSSRNDTGHDYVCNPRSLKELFGEELASDNERDLAEELEETSRTSQTP